MNGGFEGGGAMAGMGFGAMEGFGRSGEASERCMFALSESGWILRRG
jgi:hypothetical protein